MKFFRIYYLMTKDIESMKIWENIDRGKKARQKGSYKEKYITSWLNKIENTTIGNTGYSKKTVFGWSTYPKMGQILRPVPFARDKKGVYYPSGGAARLAIAYFLGHKYIPALVGDIEKTRLWQKGFSVETKHFRGMPQHIIDKMLCRRKICNLFSRFVINKKIRRTDFLYEIPDLAFRGKYSVNKLINDKEFISCIKEKRILNLSLDNGWLEVNISKYAKYITGAGSSSFVKISSLISSYCKNNKCKFLRSRYLEDITDTFDVVLYNKMAYDKSFNLFFKNRKIIYDKNDCVIYG